MSKYSVAAGPANELVITPRKPSGSIMKRSGVKAIIAPAPTISPQKIILIGSIESRLMISSEPIKKKGTGNCKIYPMVAIGIER